MSPLSTAFFPNLVEQLFHRYERIFGREENAFERHKKQLLVELEALLGDVLLEALSLLDKDTTITVYRAEKQPREIAEIKLRRFGSVQLVRLFPNINYCPCDDFKHYVLGLRSSLPTTSTAAAEAPTVRYCCAHVLLLRLVRLLRIETAVLRTEQLPSAKFNTRSEPTRMQHSKLLYEKGVLKNLKMLTQRQYSNFKFVGRLDQMKTFYTGIRALNFGEHNGTVQVSEDGFRISVESGKSVQASLFVTAACFAEYHSEGLVNFSINTNVLAECLGLFAGISCGLMLSYKGDGAPLIVVMRPHDEENISAECAIKTMRNEELIDFGLDEESASLNVVFMRGPQLCQIFQELDKAADELRLTLSPRQPYFRIDVLGVMQAESSVEVAKTSDMMLLFNCRATTSARYRNAHIRLTLKALTASSKVALKTDDSGLLEMHFILQSDEQGEMYVQFYVAPLVDI